MTITTRAGKGSELTHAELDTNFTDLRDGINVMIPKTQNSGIKTDSLGTPSYPWKDLFGIVYVPDYAAPTAPTLITYRGGIVQNQFDVNDEIQIVFHVPHDYVIGTNMFLHIHWSHTSSLVTGGSISWGSELMYSKGHNEGAFGNTITMIGIQSASTTQYQHMIAEEIISTPGGSPSLLDTNLLYPDGLICGRLFLSANTITVSGGAQPKPFIHQIDIHYQSTGIGTKQRSPDFWT